MGALRCAGETVVDLYAGIGYFTLPLLVHAGVSPNSKSRVFLQAVPRPLLANDIHCWDVEQCPSHACWT